MTFRIAFVLLALASSVSAQTRLTDRESPALVPARRLATTRAFEAWRSQSTDGWRMEIDAHSGWASFLGGGTLDLEGRAASDADFERLGLEAVRRTVSLTGIESETLSPVRVKFLPLGLIGSTDKWTVAYEQQVAGVPVFEGRVNVLFDLEGRVLSIQSSALPQVAQLGTQAAIDATTALDLAANAFEIELGLPVTSLTRPELGFGHTMVADRRTARLAWSVDVRWSSAGAQPEGRLIWVDALNGEVLRSSASVHQFDVGGTVNALITPGVAPDTPGNAPVLSAMKDLRVKSSAGSALTDAAGNFNFAGLNGPTQITAEFVGAWAHVDNDAGAEDVFIGQLSGTNNVITLNQAQVEATTAQANAFHHIGVLRDWIRSVDPTDDAADFQAYARVNLNSVCNAYYDGFSVNFFNSGSSGGSNCINTSYSTVVAHEMGHWLNVIYHTGNGADGMGEGNADVFAMYLYDDPIVGQDFLGPGAHVRSGLNNTLFCGDCCPFCHGGQVHKQGEVWMGAAWKLRARLNATHGNALGDSIANGLFSGWMNAYDQSQIKSIIETQWLVLDDTNGNLDDGTPNYTDIDGGFRDQGFPGFDLPPVVFSNVTIQGDTTDEAGPYTIDATVDALTGTAVGNVELFYDLNGSNTWTSFSMIPIGTNVYQGQLPGQASVTEVAYYLRATNSNQDTLEFPEGGALDPILFVVGVVNVLFTDDFESAGDNGWTHGTFGDTSNPHDDFQRGTPMGLAGDPSSAFSGSKVWGNDLGGGVWNGAYQNQQHNWLRSPPIDCSNAFGTQLRFQRWLGVDVGVHDQARIRVNGYEVFVNENLQIIQDGGWNEILLDISPYADGQPAVEVEFSIQSDHDTTYGGWNLDDFQVRSVTPVGGVLGIPFCFGDGSGTTCPCNNSASPGQGCANSSGQGAVIAVAGSSSVSADDLTVQTDVHLPNKPALLFSGQDQVNGGNGFTFGDGLRCAGGPVKRLDVRVTNASGEASWGPGLAPAGGWSAGDQRSLQVWYRDPNAGPCGTDFNLTHGMQMGFTP